MHKMFTFRAVWNTFSSRMGELEDELQKEGFNGGRYRGWQGRGGGRGRGREAAGKEISGSKGREGQERCRGL